MFGIGLALGTSEQRAGSLAAAAPMAENHRDGAPRLLG